MEKIDLTKQFAARLHDAMIAMGYNSRRSPSGVNILKLAEITGYSPQICRKYLRGEAIPEPVKLVEIASKLNVSAGWLLFGDSRDDNLESDQTITIPKNLLHYIFTQATDLYNTRHLAEERSDFLLDLVRDISQINANEDQSKKIIDLALASVKHFSAL
jgi:transcriptional regulator with XRE-family HTH domain